MMDTPPEEAAVSQPADHPEPDAPTIVVGFDRCDHAEIALDWAALEATRRGATLEILTTSLPTGATTWPEGAFDVMSESALGAAQVTADEGLAHVRAVAPGLTARASAVVGSPAGALVEESEHAKLVVVGTRGHGDLAGTLLGSVAFAVTAHAACPAIVVRGNPAPAGPDRPVVVGVDGSDRCAQAVRYAARAAVANDAELVLLSAWEPQSAQAMGYRTADYPTDLAERHAAELVESARLVAQEERPGVRTSSRTPEGLPGEALTAASETAGLVVVGARGHGGFAGLNLGSVCHALIHKSGAPVVVVRR